MCLIGIALPRLCRCFTGGFPRLRVRAPGGREPAFCCLQGSLRCVLSSLGPLSICGCNSSGEGAPQAPRSLSHRQSFPPALQSPLHKVEAFTPTPSCSRVSPAEELTPFLVLRLVSGTSIFLFTPKHWAQGSDRLDPGGYLAATGRGASLKTTGSLPYHRKQGRSNSAFPRRVSWRVLWRIK